MKSAEKVSSDISSDSLTHSLTHSSMREFLMKNCAEWTYYISNERRKWEKIKNVAGTAALKAIENIQKRTMMMEIGTNDFGSDERFKTGQSKVDRALELFVKRIVKSTKAIP